MAASQRKSNATDNEVDPLRLYRYIHGKGGAYYRSYFD